MKTLIACASALIESITFDDSGNEGRGGNGGLLSRKTIRHADELRLKIQQVEAQPVNEQPAQPIIKVMWAFPQEDGTFDAALLFETEDEANSFDREAIEEWGSGSDMECVEVLVSITRKVGLS